MRVVVALLAAAALIVPSPASAAGCEVVATGYEDLPNDCRYTATGPGSFQVLTATGFRIQIMDPEHRRGTLAAVPPHVNDPVSGIAVRQGTLDTQPGDVVSVAIEIAVIDTGIMGMPPHRYQLGAIRASDT